MILENRIEPEEFLELSNKGFIMDGTSGGLVIGPSHEEGGIQYLSSFGDHFKIMGELEGYEYIFNIATAALIRNIFSELNNRQRDFSPTFQAFIPEKHHTIIDARLSGNEKYRSKFIFIENRMSQAIINKYSVAKNLEYLDKLNRSFTYTFDDRDFFKTTKVNIIEVVSQNVVQIYKLDRTDQPL